MNMQPNGSEPPGSSAPIGGPALTIVGIDTGLRCTGYAFLSDNAKGDEPHLPEAGVIRLDPRTPL